MDGRRDVRILQDEPVVDMRRGRLVGKSVGMQCAENPIPTAVTSKHPACPVSAVGGWRKTDNIEASVSVAETRHGFSPVVPVTVAFHFFLGRTLTVLNEPRTALAVNNMALESGDGAHRCRVVVTSLY